jgi:hypothetical protein
MKEYTPLTINSELVAPPPSRRKYAFACSATALLGLAVVLSVWSSSWPRFFYGSSGFEELHHVSVILTADNGAMVGTSEGAEIKALMTSMGTTKYDTDHLFCEEVLHGTLFGSQIMLVTTGIGHDRAALCLRSLLQQYHRITREIMFLGTGGFSPARGGILNSDDCDAASPAATTEIVPLGSVCVSPMTTLWDCHKCVWPAEVNSACVAAPCSLHGRADLFGDWGCEYYTTTQLADEMIGGEVPRFFGGC